MGRSSSDSEGIGLLTFHNMSWGEGTPLAASAVAALAPYSTVVHAFRVLLVFLCLLLDCQGTGKSKTNGNMFERWK